MKSYKSLIITAALGMMLAACGDDSGSNAPADEPLSSSVAKAKSSSSKAKSSSSKAKSSSSVKAKSSSSVKAKSSSSKENSSSSSAKAVPSTNEKYVFSFMMENSQFVGVGSLSDNQKKIVENFIEIPNTGAIAYFNGSVYVLYVDQAMNSTLTRYKLDDKNKIADKPAATAKFTGTHAIMMKFVDNDKMYVEQALGDAITVLDPTTLKTKSTIELSKYIDEKNGAMSTVPNSAVIRDGKMFVSLAQFVDFNNMIAGPQGCVAVIDIKTDKVEKIITENMTASVGVMDDMNNTMSFVDESGDIYYYSNAAMGWMDGYKEGFVRIKKGETEFDKDWVFHLHDAAYAGKKSNNNFLMSGGTYIGNGKFLGFFGNFEDPSNYNNYEWEFVVIDLKKKTIEKIEGLTPTIPWFAPSIHLDVDGKSVVLGHADKKGGAIYRYDIASGKVKKEMEVSTGTAYYVVPLKD